MSAGPQVRETLRTSGPLWTASLVLDRLLPYPVLRHWPDRRVTAAELERQVVDVFRAWGMAEELRGRHGAATWSRPTCAGSTPTG